MKTPGTSEKYSNRFFLSILENSTDLISIIDADGNYQFVAGSVMPLLGYRPEEMVGKSAFSFIHAHDQAFTAAALEKAVLHKIPLLPHFRFRAKDGTFHWIECSVTDMVSNAEIQGYVTNSRIITRQVQEAEKKRRSQAHYESLFYNHPDAVFELDREGVFVRVNKSVPKILEYTEEQIIGSHFQQFVHRDFMPAATNAFVNTMLGKSEYLELSVVRESGQIGLLGITVFPVIVDNEVVSLQGIAKDITLQKQIENFQREQSEVLHNIMERIAESFYSLDHTWRYAYVNDYYASYVGKPKEELLGQVIWDVFPQARTTKFYQECLRVAQTGSPANFEETVAYRENAVIGFQLFPTAKGVAVHFVDVTERRLEQDRLEKLALVASRSTTIVMIKDAQRRVEWVNTAFEQATGFSLEDCYMQTCPEFLAGPQPNDPMLQHMIRKMEAGKTFQGEVLSYAKNGRKIWFYTQMNPVFDSEGRLSKYVSIRTDITDRKQREEELVQVTRDLHQQNLDLQQFSYMVSHNLRAPAANLLGLSNLLELVEKDPHLFQETLARVKASASQLDQVIRDMNHILSVRERGLELQLEEVDVQDLLEELFAGLRFAAQGFTFSISVTGTDRLKVYTSRIYLYEALKNILSNSVKFRKPAEPLHVTARLTKTLKKTEIQLQDNGIGLEVAPVRRELFRLYKRFHKGYEGRGLGLFLAKTYLNATGGRIRLDAEVGKGTLVKVKFKHDAAERVYS